MKPLGCAAQSFFRKKLDFCSLSQEAASEIKNGIMDDLRREIERITREQFLDLIWKKRTYIDVKIDQDYNISVKHKSGFDALYTLSAGERQVLALSFTAALNSLSGFNVPIIIDTPLARIDEGDPRRNVAQNLPKYFFGKQVTLLVTGAEYSNEVRDGLADSIGKEYRIVFEEREEGSEAKVIPYEG